MPEQLTYVYAVGDVALAEDGSTAQITGIDDTAVRAVVCGQLAAVVGSVDAVAFNEDALKQSFEDLRWLERTARAHHDVVDALAENHPIAPLRLATVYLDDRNVRTLLTDRADEFMAVLGRIRGRTEWGVKAFAVPAPAPVTTDSDGTSERPGLAYLQRRRAHRDHAEHDQARAQEAAAHLHDRLAALAIASRRYPPQDARLTGYEDEMVLNATYLVDDAGAEALKQEIGDWDRPEIRPEWTGPWAPYSFATLEQT